MDIDSLKISFLAPTDNLEVPKQTNKKKAVTPVSLSLSLCSISSSSVCFLSAVGWLVGLVGWLVHADSIKRDRERKKETGRACW